MRHFKELFSTLHSRDLWYGREFSAQREKGLIMRLILLLFSIIKYYLQLFIYVYYKKINKKNYIKILIYEKTP